MSVYKGVIALFVVISLYLYNGIYKTEGIKGNLIVSLNTALLFVFGAVLFNERIVFLVILSFFLSISREMIKDYEDREGDKWRKKIKYIELKQLKIIDAIISLPLLGLLLGFMKYGSSFYIKFFLPVASFMVVLQDYFLLKERIVLSIRAKKVLMIFGIVFSIFI